MDCLGRRSQDLLFVCYQCLSDERGVTYSVCLSTCVVQECVLSRASFVDLANFTDSLDDRHHVLNPSG